MRYSDLTNEAEDDDLFGASNRTHQNIRVANFQSTIPQFQALMKSLVLRSERRVAREIMNELGRVSQAFKGSEEVLDLAGMLIGEQAVQAIPHITQFIAEDPTRVESEDDMYDFVSNLAEDLRHKSELWIYLSEVIDELEEPEIEFDCAMVISGEMTSMLIHTAQAAFNNNAPAQVNEDANTGPNDFQQMQNFIRANQTPGIPPEQQVALALFRELQKQKQQNQELGAELDAAEKRIDVATQGGEQATRELGKHRSELDQEREAMGKLDQQYAERSKASQDQINILTGKLEQIKEKPGVSKTEIENLENQIEQLTKNGIGADKVKELERTINSVQSMQKVDDNAIQDLVSQINAAQAKADELVKTRAEVGGEIEQTTVGLQDEIEQLKQQLAHFREVEQTVDELDAQFRTIAPRVNQIAKQQMQPYAQDTVKMARSALDNDPSQMSLPGVETPPTPTQRMATPDPQFTDPGHARAAVNMVKKAPPRSLQQAQAPGLHEDTKLFNAIRWATGK